VLMRLYYRVVRWVRIKAGYGDYIKTVYDRVELAGGGNVSLSVVVGGASHSFRPHDKYVPVLFDETWKWLNLDMDGEQ